MPDLSYDLAFTLRLLERIDWSAERLARHRTERLRVLLRHAADGSPFWRKRLDGLDPEAATLDDLARIPVLHKEDLMAHWDEIVTVPGLSLEACRRHLASLPPDPAPDDFVLRGCLVFSTGGTTGRQAIVARTPAEWKATNYTQVRWAIRRLLADGVTLDPNVVQAGVLGDTPRHYAGVLTRATGIQPVPVSIPLAEQCARLEAMKPEVLTGYPSALVRLARAAIAGGLRIEPITISLAGECLTGEIRGLLRAAWPQARIFNVYGSTESGLVASSTGGDDPCLYVNDDFFAIEPLDDCGTPVAPGESGETLAVTCLESRSLPLIRYELTDRVTLASEPSPEGLAFTRIARLEGRTCDWLRWGDAEAHPYTFTTPLTDDPAVGLYQVRQTAGGAEVLVVPTGAARLDRERLLGEIARGLRAAGVPSPTLSLTCVEEIPRVGAGQKHRSFVPFA